MIHSMLTTLGRIVRDEDGSAITEYAIVVGLVIVVAIAVVAQYGTRVLARWNSVDSKLGQPSHTAQTL
jgi:Flp pilus assembly pilin Flp